MRILEKRVYVGPNLYANFKVIRLLLDLGSLEQHPSAEIDGFVDRLLRPSQVLLNMDVLIVRKVVSSDV